MTLEIPRIRRNLKQLIKTEKEAVLSTMKPSTHWSRFFFQKEKAKALKQIAAPLFLRKRPAELRASGESCWGGRITSRARSSLIYLLPREDNVIWTISSNTLIMFTRTTQTKTVIFHRTFWQYIYKSPRIWLYPMR